MCAETKDDLVLEADAKVLLVGVVTGFWTGAGVVGLNLCVHTVEHVIQGTPDVGFAWIEALPTASFRSPVHRAVLAPVLGGAFVSLLKGAQDRLKSAPKPPPRGPTTPTAAASSTPPPPAASAAASDGASSILDALAAAVTLGTGASLGPEGPSVDIGTSLASQFRRLIPRRYATALLAAGSAAGISAGFNAPISGVFFALETVLEKAGKRGKSNDLDALEDDANAPTRGMGAGVEALDLATVTLAAVIAAIVSQLGLGSEPAFRIPQYQLGSYVEVRPGVDCSSPAFACVVT